MSTSPAALRQGQQQGKAKPPAFSVKEFSRLNLSRTRLSIEDSELAFLENAMLLDKHPVPVPLYNGAAGTSLNATSVVKESYGCALTYGIFTAPHPVAIVVFEDGSAWQRDFYLDQPVDTMIAPVGTFGASPKRTAIKIWQDGPVLFIDELAGYCKWDGVLFTTIDSSKTGSALAVFEGHVWLKTAPRTITFTAPNSFSDFASADGAGSFKITDDAFQGEITTIFSTVEQLWLLGPSAIDALGNVATSGGVTTFAVTNAVNSLGTVLPDSVSAYFRALTFATGYSVHSLLGVTPQKLSSSIDRLFASLDNVLTTGPRVGLAVQHGVIILVFLYAFTDGTTGAVRSELVCFQEGQWFLCRTPDLGGNRILDLVTLTVGPHGLPELYGIDGGGFLYRIFARIKTPNSLDDPAQGTMTVSFKLFDLGEPTKGHQGIKIGLDLSAPSRMSIVPITLTYVTERDARVQTVYENFFALTDSPLGLRYALLRRDYVTNAQRIGLTVQIPCVYGVGIEALHIEQRETDDNDPQDPPVQLVNFTNALGQIVEFTNAQALTAADWLASRVN